MHTGPFPCIIGVMGRARSGKDTFAVTAQKAFQQLHDMNYDVARLAAPLKRAVMALYDFSHDQVEGAAKEEYDRRWGIRPRDAMVRLTQDTMNFVGHDFFSRRLWGAWDRGAFPRPIIVPDVRYAHDIQWIHERGGLVVKVARRLGNDVPHHDAENGIDELVGDVFFENNGSIDEFKNAIVAWAQSFGLEAKANDSKRYGVTCPAPPPTPVVNARDTASGPL